jgi:hypothetical protein
MEITTAITQLNKERDFLGLGMLELLQDIQKNGEMVYCEKTMRAYRVFMRQATQLFAPVAE